MIGFSAGAEVLLPLTKLDVDVAYARLRPSAAARFGAAFRLLRTTIERDVRWLREDWRQVGRPDVVAFGIGDLDAATTAGIGTAGAFLTEPGTSPGAAVHGFTRTLTRSIIDSGTAAAEHGRGVLQVPARVGGYTNVHGAAHPRRARWIEH